MSIFIGIICICIGYWIGVSVADKRPMGTPAEYTTADGVVILVFLASLVGAALS